MNKASKGRPKGEENRVRVLVGLTPACREALRALSRYYGISMSSVVEICLRAEAGKLGIIMGGEKGGVSAND